MSDLDQLIEEREIEIRCWQCPWTESRSLRWLSSRRQMSCPKCESVIVLNTSGVRREIMQQRKQLEALHGQMQALLASSRKLAGQPPSPPGPRQELDLALARRHPKPHATVPKSSSARRSRRG